MRWAVAALALSFTLLASDTNGAAQRNAAAAIAATPQVEKAADKGDIKIVYVNPRDPRYLELQSVLRGSRVFDEVAGAINTKLALPRDLLVRFAECGTVNAFFDSTNKSITMCYELIVAVAEDFSNLNLTEEVLNEATLDTILFVFLHETGHALIDVLRIPVTGREEDAVDQLATLMLLESGDAGEDAALNGAAWFLLQGEKSNLDELAFWDEHSLDAQRFYNIACWVYGQNPVRHSDLVTEGWLPEERAVRCADEYRKISDSWTRLLSPYLKK